MRRQDVFILWPEVPRFYADCQTDEHRLKQRIRRAFEKADKEEQEYAGLAELLYEKLRVSVEKMCCRGR